MVAVVGAGDILKKASGRSAQVRKRQDLFLDAFTKTGTVLGASRRCNISRETVRLWRKNDSVFAERFEDADLDITETLETKAMSMAMAGDTTMVIFLLKSRRPEKYRDHVKHEHGGEIKTTPAVDMTGFSKQELLEMAGIKG